MAEGCIGRQNCTQSLALPSFQGENKVAKKEEALILSCQQALDRASREDTQNLHSVVAFTTKAT